MKIKKRFFILFLVSFSLTVFIILVWIGFNWLKNITEPFQSFSVTINNNSDYNIESVEVGIIKGTSKDIYTEPIKSGETVKIKPKLSLNGEGAIYIKYIDSRGGTREKTVCGYTEYLSGYSKVTISNVKATVEEKCM
ncbi:hypothetical protein [Paenibacillus abyssi]|uniref:Uncharacterized protein n=1 Tax=Paenibacillus abyssi TaxID=1340531 RepID=A0A917D1B6_9BACL|nr:hypothetical protein [Paenibacillus abyssi]GGG03904.1 hypothetical protein GCM10010916_21210 [Paenibacillus abyssi]